MIIIKVDFTKCKGCYECDTILPNFRSKYGGIMKFDSSPQDEEGRAAAYRVQDNCKAGAIIINTFNRKKD